MNKIDHLESIALATFLKQVNLNVMRKLKIVVWLVLIGSMSVIVSCRDEIELYDKTHDVPTALGELDSRSEGSVTADVIDGIVRFQDEQHALSLMSNLQNAYENAAETASFDELNFFRGIQNDIGFQSLLVSQLEEEESQELSGGYSLQELEEWEDHIFVHDVFERFFLNHRYEVGLGSNIAVYYGPNMIFNVSNNDKEALANFRDIKRPGKELPSFLNNNNITINNYLHVVKHKVVRPDYPDVGDPDVLDWRMDEYDLDVSSSRFNCTPLTRQFSASLERSSIEIADPDNPNDDFRVYESWPASYRLDLGDGNVVEFDNVYELDYTHQYQNPGLYSVTLEVSYIPFEGEAETIFEDLEVNVSLTCVKADVSYSERVYNNQGNRRMHNEIWFKYGGFPFKRAKSGAKTHAWRRKSNGKWKREKAYVKVHIDALFSASCGSSVAERKRETDTCNNCKKKRCQVSYPSLGSEFLVGDIFSEHEVDFKDNLGIVDNIIVLDPCN